MSSPDALPQITFTCDPDLVDRIPHPAPAGRFVPEWFRHLPREMGMKDAHGLPGLTMRACLPVTDVMSRGWIIPLPFDVWTEYVPGTQQLTYDWDEACPFNAIEPHHPGQIGADKPPFQGVAPLKFLNPWRVILPDGWSAMFTHPFNHFELPFRTFDGAVDCDALDVPVNVPFVLLSGTPVRLLAGTPMIQVVPYQRSAQLRQAQVRAETPDEAAARRTAHNRKHTEESVYTREWRRRHERL